MSILAIKNTKTIVSKETKVDSLEAAKSIIDTAFKLDNKKQLTGVSLYVYDCPENGIDVKLTWRE